MRIVLDINGAWETETGPNAPLYHEEGKGEQVSFASSKCIA